MNWSPDVLGDLFFDNQDYRGLLYWFDAIIEKKKFNKLKKGESMNVTFEHFNAK